MEVIDKFGILYYPTEGKFFRNGKELKALDRYGYGQIRFQGKTVRSHRLAWFMYYGYWPEKYIDHKDRNRANNSIDNLREADENQNSWNYSKRRNNTSSVSGVYFCKTTNKWRAMICVNRKRVCLGRYFNLDEAEEVVKEARNKYHGDFSHD